MDPYTLILIAVLLGMFGFQFYLSNKRKKMAEVINSNIVVGARAVTFSGIVGDITAVDGDLVSLKTGSAVIELKKGAIREAKPQDVAVKSAVIKPAVKKTAK